MQFQLARLLEALDAAGLLVGQRGPLPDSVHGLADDSRSVTQGSMFLAVRGSARDGHDYLATAAEKGASVAMVEDPGRTKLPVIIVKEGRKAAAVAAGAAYGDPSRELRMIGVTGTNGKSTTAGILRHLLDKPGSRSASIGTLGVLFGSEAEVVPGGAELTTPGPVELQRVLRELVDRDVKTVAMEVSSHSLDQRRIDGLSFDAAVFTNLTRDHLDYHGTMEAYFEAKARLIARRQSMSMTRHGRRFRQHGRKSSSERARGRTSVRPKCGSPPGAATGLSIMPARSFRSACR
jgi:UDP-N-acetylmuramoyl-L-alanyl-D-glutamate--2,6-diaminopimelate ligase